MGNAQIIFDEGEKHTVKITIPAILPIVNYLPRNENEHRHINLLFGDNASLCCLERTCYNVVCN